MPEEKGTSVVGVATQTKAAEPKKITVSKESVYSAEELANAPQMFGTRKECVAAALKFYGKKEATVKEAQELIRKFLGKEVK